MDRLTKVENELEAQGTTIAMLEQELEAQGATIAMLAQRIELLLIQGNNDREQTAFNEEPAFTQEDKTMTTVNEKGFCVGDEVKIISDKQSFWSVSGRRKPTTLEGAVGVITRVTRCTVKICVTATQETVTKYNYNVSLITPFQGTEQVKLPNGVIKIRF